MGQSMARNLLNAGFPLTVWNRTRAKAEALIPDGALLAETAGAAVETADVVISMLENGPVVDQVLFGESDAASAAKPGTLFIETGELTPTLKRKRAQINIYRKAEINTIYA